MILLYIGREYDIRGGGGGGIGGEGRGVVVYQVVYQVLCV